MPQHPQPVDDGDLATRVRRLEDLHAIGQLRAHFCQALDGGRWDDLVDLFTADAQTLERLAYRGTTQVEEAAR